MAIELDHLVVRDATALRAWLESDPADGVWLALAKKGAGVAPTSLVYAEAVDEALCFGWIDGQARRVDDAVYEIRFTPRRPRSLWSARNVQYVERLIADGRMTPRGLAEVERAKADGRWEQAYAGPAAMEVPEDFAAALAAEPGAAGALAAASSQDRYAMLHRLATVKRASTRERLIAEFAARLAEPLPGALPRSDP
jgi:uncharacterized protein YdeI (YjbR/CyaY-like superfamily)